MFTNPTLYDFNGAWNHVSGVYGIMNASRQMIYIGETDDFARRMAEHQANTLHCMHRYGPRFVLAEVINDKATRCARERQLILEYNPPCNRV
jgi:predicted GIY-YIG superfamily endonuclease